PQKFQCNCLVRWLEVSPSSINLPAFNLAQDKRNKTQRANYAHKLTKAAGPLARRPSRLGRLATARRHGGRTSLPPNLSSVAAAAVPLCRPAREAAFAA